MSSPSGSSRRENKWASGSNHYVKHSDNYHRFALDSRRMDSRFGRGGNGNDSRYRGYSRSRSRSRERSRERGAYRRRASRSRSRERYSHHRHGHSPDRDLYRDLIDDDYKDEERPTSRKTFERQNYNEDSQDHRDHDQQKRRDTSWSHDGDSRNRNNDDYEKDSERGRGRSGSNGNRAQGKERESHYSSDDSEGTDEVPGRMWPHNGQSTEALNNIIIFGLNKHITEADIMAELVKVNLQPASIRVMRKKPTGASRCFAFVEFKTVEEAKQWMDITQGVLQLGDNRVAMQYSHNRTSDWTCIKCGASNFKRRFQCYMCSAARSESENSFSAASEGIDEVSRILTKKIMLRNLDALTNEEGVLTALQKHLPKLAKTVSKLVISRDTLTQASRGICYLHFDTLVDSMEVFNGLTTLDPPLKLDDREVIITYCIDIEDRKVIPTDLNSNAYKSFGHIAAVAPSGVTGNYTMEDVPRLAEYSASLYATNPAEHTYFFQYYSDYYTAEIRKHSNPVDPNLTEANSGAAVALSAMQRNRKRNFEPVTSAPALPKAEVIVAPRGNDGKVYPTPDVSKYQFDETSGYYYDATTGLYYDAHSQYYYNNETGAYLYWDQKRRTYVLATPASTQAALQEVIAEAEAKEEEARKAKEKEKEKEGGKQDKVKVAKKIVKDMEKWAKQLNQKKDYTPVVAPQPVLEGSECPSTSRSTPGVYADVGFSILEKKERAKGAEGAAQPVTPVITKLVNAYGGASDSEEDNTGANQSSQTLAGTGGRGFEETDYVDFQKLTCLLCKRAFQSQDILQKHLKMSNLHKENLAKLQPNQGGANNDEGFSYRDRAKERRLKYGESDPPPPNHSRERFEQQIKTLQSSSSVAATASLPISSSNVGSRLMQKMGWSEGQGLGRKNQGRTQIVEAEGRSNNVGLGNKSGKLTPGDDYKSYIKKMMRQRYDNA
ncbi:RNA-binding protein 5 isoform X2 [Drosophila bipectinata]|uniref:RNA-binding protein 5 isoform X2 n=1 Tax=Drosophila bipectinata TaxID=42026 RepID=UPI0038B32C6A